MSVRTTMRPTTNESTTCFALLCIQVTFARSMTGRPFGYNTNCSLQGACTGNGTWMMMISHRRTAFVGNKTLVARRRVLSFWEQTLSWSTTRNVFRSDTLTPKRKATCQSNYDRSLQISGGRDFRHSGRFVWCFFERKRSTTCIIKTRGLDGVAEREACTHGPCEQKVYFQYMQFEFAIAQSVKVERWVDIHNWFKINPRHPIRSSRLRAKVHK